MDEPDDSREYWNSYQYDDDEPDILIEEEKVIQDGQTIVLVNADDEEQLYTILVQPGYKAIIRMEKMYD